MWILFPLDSPFIVTFVKKDVSPARTRTLKWRKQLNNLQEVSQSVYSPALAPRSIASKYQDTNVEKAIEQSPGRVTVILQPSSWNNKDTQEQSVITASCSGATMDYVGLTSSRSFSWTVPRMSSLIPKDKEIWTASSEFGTYRLCEQRRFRRACASAQSRQNLRCSLIQAVSQEEPSDRKPDPWPVWMTGHAQLRFVMTECSKQIRLTGLNYNLQCYEMTYGDNF